MKRLCYTLLAVLFACLVASNAAAQADYAAMIMDQRDGQAAYADGPLKGKPIEIMEFLYPSDRISVPEGATVVLNFFKSSRREEIRGPVVVTIAADGSSVAGGSGNVDRQTVAYLPPKSEIASSFAQNFGTVAFRAAGKAKPEPPANKIAVLNAPDSAYIPGSDIAIQWKAVEGAGGYRLQLKDEADRGIGKWETADTLISLPGSKLIPGECYAWRLTAMKPGEDAMAPADGKVCLLTQDRFDRMKVARDEIESRLPADSAERLTALNLLYQRFGLKNDAVRVLQVLARMLPDNPIVINQLKQLSPHTVNN